MALTANRDVSRYVDQELRTFPVAAATKVYKGALVGIDRATGTVRGFIPGDMFAGIAYEEIDNSAGEDAERMIRLYTQGDFVLDAAFSSVELVGAPVYAQSDENVSLLGETGAGYCGILLAVLGSNKAIIRIDPLAAARTELAVHIPLASSTSGATTNPVLIAQRAISIVSVDVVFNAPPDQGVLNVGTGAITPNELINNFNLAGLSANTPVALTSAARSCAAGQRIWAKVSQASSGAGVGGMLTIRYVELT